jgi:hypothetical protein
MDSFSLILLMNWIEQKWKFDLFRWAVCSSLEIVLFDFPSFVPRVTLTRICGRWHLKCSKLNVCCGIANRSLWLLGKGHFMRSLGRNHQGKCPIYKCCKLFNEAGWICKGASASEWPVIAANVNEVRVALFRSRRKSTSQTARRLSMPQLTVHKILRTLLI